MSKQRRNLTAKWIRDTERIFSNRKQLLQFLSVEMALQGGHVEESRVGAKRVIKGLTLLANTSEPIREPWTLSPPVMTEDMLLEKEAALSAIGTARNAYFNPILRRSKTSYFQALVHLNPTLL